MRNQDTAPLLVLIGFMGAGKTTLGRLLARQLGCRMIDLDHAISSVHGAIPDIFASRGETGFRAIEHHHLAQMLPAMPRPGVLALGGGAFIQSANRALLAEHSATTIFLDAPFDVLKERIAGSGHQRPLAQDLERLHWLYLQRRPIYLLAQHVFDASATDPAGLLADLVQLAAELGISAPARDTL